MSEYTYFILGTLLGIAIATYFWISKEEKEEKAVKLSQHLYSTKKLDITMETITTRISHNINNLKRELTEDEKNEIIMQCYKEKFYL